MILFLIAMLSALALSRGPEGVTPVEAGCRLFSLQTCADTTATSLRWWRRAVYERRIPVVKVGRLVRIREEDLEEFIAANTVPARDEQRGSRGNRGTK